MKIENNKFSKRPGKVSCVTTQFKFCPTARQAGCSRLSIDVSQQSNPSASRILYRQPSDIRYSSRGNSLLNLAEIILPGAAELLNAFHTCVWRHMCETEREIYSQTGRDREPVALGTHALLSPFPPGIRWRTVPAATWERKFPMNVSRDSRE